MKNVCESPQSTHNFIDFQLKENIILYYTHIIPGVIWNATIKIRNFWIEKKIVNFYFIFDKKNNKQSEKMKVGLLFIKHNLHNKIK